MHDAQVIDGLELKFNSLIGDLDERGRRRWAATEAMALGYGGITVVSLATGLSDRTIRNGIKELQSDNPLPSSRQRRNGGGRKPLEESQHNLIDAVDRLVEPTERGDPQSPLRWTCKSLSNLQRELVSQGYRVGRTKIANVLRSLGYSLQGNRKTREGTDHPDRNAQFEHIARRVRACQRGGRPAVSVDTKKKETLGKKANVGKEYRPKGEPLEVDTHDFPDKELGKAIPYGVYDIDSNEAWVSVGISRDTGEFAVEAIRRWWRQLGKKRYSMPKRLLITADSGGSNTINAMGTSFLVSGAQNVVASHWGVNAKSTSKLAEKFMQQIHRLGLKAPLSTEEYATILHEARREVSADPEFRYPFDWGPFTLSTLVRQDNSR